MHVVHQGRQGREGLSADHYAVDMQGFVKLYDPTTGAGVVVRDDDRSEVYLRAGSLAGSVFRLLRQGQRINFDVEMVDGTPFATAVRVGSDGY